MVPVAVSVVRQPIFLSNFRKAMSPWIDFLKMFSRWTGLFGWRAA